MPVNKIIRPGVTLLVAASDASDKVQGLADYVCDGTADQTEIDAALAALPALGGRVQLSEGTFALTATLTLPSGKNIQLCGVNTHHNETGRGATRLNFTLGASANCVEFADDSYPQLIEGIEIYGDGTNTDKGLLIGASSAWKVAKDITIENVAGNFVEGAIGSSQCWLERVFAYEIGAVIGFKIGIIACMLLQCQVSRSGATGLGGTAGFRTAATSITMIGCTATRITIGFLVQALSVDVALIGCYSEGCQRAVDITGTAPNQPVGTLVSSFYAQGSTINDGTGAIRAALAIGTTIINPVVKTTTGDIAISMTADADTVAILGGWTDDTTVIVDAGASRLKIDNAYTYINENKGTGSILNSNTSIAVAHGLSVTPTVDDIRITLAENPTNTPGAIWVDTIGASNFTVNCENDPGESNLDFGWHVRVY